MEKLWLYTPKIEVFEHIYSLRTLIYYGKTMVLWKKTMVLGKKLWYYTENYGTLMNYGETMVLC